MGFGMFAHDGLALGPGLLLLVAVTGAVPEAFAAAPEAFAAAPEAAAAARSAAAAGKAIISAARAGCLRKRGENTGCSQQLSRHGASCRQVEVDTAAARKKGGACTMRASKEKHNCKQQAAARKKCAFTASYQHAWETAQHGKPQLMHTDLCL